MEWGRWEVGSGRWIGDCDGKYKQLKQNTSAKLEMPNRSPSPVWFTHPFINSLQFLQQLVDKKGKRDH
jgi:hypothetical protein